MSKALEIESLLFLIITTIELNDLTHDFLFDSSRLTLRFFFYLFKDAAVTEKKRKCVTKRNFFYFCIEIAEKCNFIFFTFVDNFMYGIKVKLLVIMINEWQAR